MDNKLTRKAADNIRILALSMVEKAKSGHPRPILQTIQPAASISETNKRLM